MKSLENSCKKNSKQALTETQIAAVSGGFSSQCQTWMKIGQSFRCVAYRKK